MSIKCIVSHHENKQSCSKLIKQNPFTKNCRILIADGEDMGTTYNKIIKKLSLDSVDGWIIFCKSDFAFCENIDLRTDNLKTNCIYGPSGFKRKLRKFHKGILRIGRFFQGDSNGVFSKVGKTVIFPTKVIYLDHNCFMLHSSIIEKYNISFSENLEDSEILKVFCRNLRSKHIHPVVIPISCYKVNS